MAIENTYPGLKFKASELSAFGVCMEIFVISIKNTQVVRFTPDDPQRFRDWLTAHGVRDIDNEKKNVIAPAIKPKNKRSL